MIVKKSRACVACHYTLGVYMAPRTHHCVHIMLFDCLRQRYKLFKCSALCYTSKVANLIIMNKLHVAARTGADDRIRRGDTPYAT
jgi:hypothetical protein